MKPYYEDKDVTVLNGDVMEVLPQLSSESVDCCITSPPYWGLRDYKSNGQIGLEATPEEYVAKMVQVFREVRRVLKKEGTLWLNLGDSYAGSNQGHGTKQLTAKQASNTGTQWMVGKELPRLPDGLKPKDLIGIPWRCAFALQADGWWLRQDIIWSKPNPMPESVTDRCTKSHEYIFLLSKSAKYYYDAEAIKEEANYDGRNDTVMKGSDKYANGFVPNQSPQTFHQRGHERWDWKDGIAYRNKRSVWEITTKPYKEAHFATYPPALVEPCILAGTSLKGVCPDCGKVWERIVERFQNKEESNYSREGRGILGRKENQHGGLAGYKNTDTTTTGWQPTCKCGKEPIPATVLDPFAGSGTTLQVAKHLNRKAVGIEIKSEYCDLIIDRCRQQVMNMEGI